MDPVMGRAENEVALERGLLAAIAASRWWTWVWMAVVLVIDARNDSFAHLPAGIALVALALAFTARATVMVRTEPSALLRPSALATELAVATSLVFTDHWGYGSSHPQSLGSAWPLASVMSIGLVLGAPGGAAVGLLLGVLCWLGSLWFVPGRWSGDRSLAAWGSVVLFTLTGAVAGYAAARLRDAERRHGMRARVVLADDPRTSVGTTTARSSAP